MSTSCIVGIAGGTGSGKTTLAKGVLDRLGADRALVLPHDAYYRDLAHLPLEERAQTNFDHPDALETTLLVAHLDALERSETVRIPVYDFESHTRRMGEGAEVRPRAVVVVEGILIYAEPALRERMDLKVFVDASEETRLARRIERDVRERGRSLDSVMAQYHATARPMHDRFVEPGEAHADLVVSGTGDVSEEIKTVVTRIGEMLARS
ncbi:MAG: uridine kinase [Candidatus Latescibacteria bacterium]|jgi:uridine kinase|nr:uridine kinase [Candidatus Latescibacterota bacterium]